MVIDPLRLGWILVVHLVLHPLEKCTGASAAPNVSSKNTFRKHSNLHTAGAENLGDNDGYPSGVFVTSGTKVQCIAGSSNLDNCSHFLHLVTILDHLRLGGFLCLLALNKVGWRWQQNIYFSSDLSFIEKFTR